MNRLFYPRIHLIIALTMYLLTTALTFVILSRSILYCL
jgi:hypothetical protein